MDHEDQINDIVLAGWPEEYESIVDQIEGRETSPTITELHEKLLNHEAKLFSAAVFLINRIPTPNLDNETPYQKLFQQAPNYNRLRVFGSLCFPWRRPCTKIKMEDQSKGSVKRLCLPRLFHSRLFPYLKRIPLSNLPTGRIYKSRHVIFEES